MVSVPAAFALLSACCFGTGLVVTQLGLRRMSSYAGALISIPVCVILFWSVAPWMLDFGGWNTDGAAVFAVIGLFFPAAVTLLTYESNRRLGPTATGSIANTSPLFALLGAVWFLGESASLRAVAGTAGIVLGVTVLSMGARGAAGGGPGRALALPFGAALVRASAQIGVKTGLALWPSAFAAALIGYTASMLVMFVFCALAQRNHPLAFTRSGVGWFAVGGLVNGAAVLAMYAALARGPVTLVAPIVAIYPLVTLILSLLVLRGEGLNARVLLGCAISVAGVVLIVAG